MIRFSDNLKMHKIVEMAQITKPSNSIEGFNYLKVYILNSGDTNYNAGRKEHNPAHFHIIHDSGKNVLNFTVNINTLEIETVYTNKAKEFTIRKFNNTYKWVTSEQGDLKKALEKWLKKSRSGIQNYKIICLSWNTLNPELEQVSETDLA
jgi:hypothetical protein